MYVCYTVWTVYDLSKWHSHADVTDLVQLCRDLTPEAAYLTPEKRVSHSWKKYSLRAMYACSETLQAADEYCHKEQWDATDGKELPHMETYGGSSSKLHSVIQSRNDTTVHSSNRAQRVIIDYATVKVYVALSLQRSR